MIDMLTAKKLNAALAEYIDADAAGRRDFDFPGSIPSIAGLLYALKIAVLREDDALARGTGSEVCTGTAKAV